MLQPSLLLLPRAGGWTRALWRGGWDTRAVLGAQRQSGNVGVAVSSSSSPLPAGRARLCWSCSAGQREAWAAPGVPRAHTGGGSKGCALGRQQCQGALSPCSRLCWGVARVISHSLPKCPGVPIPPGARGSLDLTACPRPFVPCGHDKDQSHSHSSGASASWTQWGSVLYKLANIVAAAEVSEAS